MAFDYFIEGQPKFADLGANGWMVGDGNAWPMPATTLTAAAGAYQLAAADTSKLNSTDYVEISGAGPGGVDDYYMVNQIDSGVAWRIYQLKPLATAVNAANVQKYVRVMTKFRPAMVRLVNLVTSVEYEWLTGMLPNQAVKRDAAGVRSFLTSGGIIVDSCGFAFHPSMAPGASDKLAWSVRFGT